MKDPIVDETRNWRQEYAAEFNYDIKAIVGDLQRREKEHPERMAPEQEVHIVEDPKNRKVSDE